jgi:hypothetical protein
LLPYSMINKGKNFSAWWEVCYLCFQAKSLTYKRQDRGISLDFLNQSKEIKLLRAIWWLES